MSLLPKSIHRCRRYPTKFNSGRDIPMLSDGGASRLLVGRYCLCLPFIRPGVSLLIFHRTPRQHSRMISSFLCSLVSAFKTRRSLALENLALRQQLVVLQRSVKRPRLSNVDRGFWVLLRRV